MSQIIPTYKRWPLRVVEAHGCTVFDESGEEYLDLIGGIAVATVGHSHPHVVDAIKSQAERLIHVSNLYETEPQMTLADRLSSISGGKQSFFCNSGAEAVECALKLARKWGHESGRTKIVATDGAFHGRTFGALSATGQPGKKTAFEPLVPDFVHVPYGDASAIEAAVDGSTAAVLLEPIQGEAGVVVPEPGYLTEVRDICDRAGVLLIFDEIQTGLARTGQWFAYEHEGVVPDILTLAKALAGGLPMGACLASSEVAAAFAPGDHATTFGGGPVVAAAALAVLEVVEKEGLAARAADLGPRVLEAFEDVPGVVSVRGRGLLIGIVLEEPKAHRVAEIALENHVLVNNATDNVVRLAPPLVISDDELARGIDVVAAAIGEAS